MVLQIVYLNLVQIIQNREEIIQNLAETMNIQGLAIIINLLILDILQATILDQIIARRQTHLFLGVVHPVRLEEAHLEVEKSARN
jgi:hypothetical protein